MKSICLASVAFIALSGNVWATDAWRDAEANGRKSQEAIQFCYRYANGWLAQVDSKTGLIPRNLKADYYWNSWDCGADNFPFLALTGFVTDQYHLKQAALNILKQERQKTRRVGNLPWTFDFAKQDFITEKPDMKMVIFGAAEYAKDGLLPMTELLGPGPWLDRMQEMIKDVWKYAPEKTPRGKMPTTNLEVNGDLLQVMSRLYWITGKNAYKKWCYRIADEYLIHQDMLSWDRIALRDHGCEILGGLSETYLIASIEDLDHKKNYQAPLRAVLDKILEMGVNADGMMTNGFNPKTGAKNDSELSDSWGYVYDAFLTVAWVDDDSRYQDAAIRAVSNVHKYLGDSWEGNSADGYADSIEGAINLLNRYPVASGFNWVDEAMPFIFDKQRPDGVIEGWHGDGNSARTSMMYALWKTQGVSASPWRTDVQLGSVLDASGTLSISIKTDWAWHGAIRFDRPRHRDYMRLPVDYARINQFPEWYTAEAGVKYEVQINSGEVQKLDGSELWNFYLALPPGGSARIAIRRLGEQPTERKLISEPPYRTMAYESMSKDSISTWQSDLRSKLAKIMRIDDLIAKRSEIPLEQKIVSTEESALYTRQEIEFRSTPERTIKAVVTIPKNAVAGSTPAVVCIHGHSGDRFITYNPDSPYKAFAQSLAERGFVTIATDLGQHELCDKTRTLTGERLWDLMRCVDYVESLTVVDRARIGCAGLSLGGEMAMWLGATDTRIKATVSCGFLTWMDIMERNHCLCWKFDGLRELVDFPDIYALIAPRFLECQNGLQEAISQFSPIMARRAFDDLKRAWIDAGVPDNAELFIHKDGHVLDVPEAIGFLASSL